ncbi:MAG: DNA alkylation repair protein [Anaerolineae bacterium CG_4_9_14_0_8_um_filter_58_9]|nr:MAG: DNA alkylation repair protein [Anaerolineae bacterium CG_4_9_14_0_8_um_filter_58_9]
MDKQEVIAKLQSLANPVNVAGMARYGINPKNTLGISIYILREIAKEIGRDDALADELWASGIHEARVLASYIADPGRTTEERMDRWAADFDSWDVCDQVSGFFEETPFAYQKAVEWSARREEFVKRAAFAIMAGLAVHDKKADDSQFEQFLAITVRESSDERNYVKKAVNWALRNIGKRNRCLNEKAIAAARQIQQINSKSARWIAADALRELTAEKTQGKLRD